MNDLMIFEEHEVEVFEFEGQVLFNPYHVGECLELMVMQYEKQCPE